MRDVTPDLIISAMIDMGLRDSWLRWWETTQAICIEDFFNISSLKVARTNSRPSMMIDWFIKSSLCQNKEELTWWKLLIVIQYCCSCCCCCMKRIWSNSWISCSSGPCVNGINCNTIDKGTRRYLHPSHTFNTF